MDALLPSGMQSDELLFALFSQFFFVFWWGKKHIDMLGVLDSGDACKFYKDSETDQHNAEAT